MTETVAIAANSDSSDTLAAGSLYLVGTPIGNLEDITLRALRVLGEVDVIAAEDTRRTGKLLQHFQLHKPQVSYHEHNRQQRIPQLLARLAQGESVALVTDAGMPGICDPGYELVCACVAQQIPVVPVPGPVAVITALAAAGLPCDRFVFEGFLPAKGKARTERLSALAVEPRTAVLYESPHRLLKTLADLTAALSPDRAVVLARELTKCYEEFWRGTLAEALAHYQTLAPRGEFTLVLAPAPVSTPAPAAAEITAQLKGLLAQGLSRSEASRQLSQGLGLPKREVYQLSLEIDIYSLLQDKSAQDTPLD